MKKRMLLLATLPLITLSLMSTSCGIHIHRYVKFNGVISASGSYELDEYYICRECRSYKDKDENDIKLIPSGENRLKPYYTKDSLNAPLVFGHDFQVFYCDDFKNEVEECMSNIDEIISKEESSYPKLDNEIIGINLYFSYLYNDYKYLEILKYTFNDERYINMFTETYELILDIQAFYTKMEVDIAGSRYRKNYYKNKTDEEIDSYVSTLNPDVSAEKSRLKAYIQNVENDFSSNNFTDIALLARQNRDLRNELANLSGYATFMDSAFDSYSRDYSVSDAYSIEPYIKEYIVPLYNNLSEKNQADRSSLSNDENIEVRNLVYGFFGAYHDEIYGYVKSVGGGFEKSYDDLMSCGNFFISSGYNDATTAYNTSFVDGTPYIFLQQGYYSSSKTFCHEFGHLNAENNCTCRCLDLNETHSQGSEALFYTYLKNNSKNENKALNYYVDVNVYDFVNSILTSYLYFEMDEYLFKTTGDLSTTMMVNKWEELCDEYNVPSLKDNEIWVYEYFLQPGYYISYATSALASLELYSVAQKDYAQAVDIYNKLYDHDDEEMSGFTSVITNAGLKNVFEEATFKEIYNAFINE